MGAELSLLAPTAPSIAVSAYVDVLDQIQYYKQIGSSRFLKTIKANDRDGTIIVKLFIQPNQNPLQLAKWAKKLQKERDILLKIPGTLPFQKIIETDRAGYLIRQYIKTNMYDRISTRPFLKEIEKKWVVFQLLQNLKRTHEKGIVHGDLKTENILVTSWNWILLSDFETFKPAYLPIDNPGIFSFYFDTSQRRSCYLAPERFVTNEENINSEATLDPKMDIFSLGCVIAEIFLEGSSTFTLSQLFKYKNGEFEPNLSGIRNDQVREMVSSMISLNPDDRLTIEEYLEKCLRELLFPESFYNFTYDYFSHLNELTNSRSFSTIEACLDCDFRIKSLFSNYDKIIESLHLQYNIATTEASDITGLNNEFIPIKLSLPGLPDNYRLKSTNQISDINNSCLLFLSVVLSNLRNTRSEISKIQALELILALSERLSDEDKLERCLPYIVTLLDDESINVKATALKSLTQILLLVDSITSINIEIFPEYIIPKLVDIMQDTSTYVRMIFANCLPYIAQTSIKFLDFAKLLKLNTNMDTSVFMDSTIANQSTISKSIAMLFDASKQNLSSEFETLAVSLLIDANPTVKIAVLRNILPLCAFFGQEKTNDLILLHLNTYLNIKDSQLRAIFIESVVGLSIYVGVTGLEHYILPLLVQSLTDSEELIVVKVLKSFQDLIMMGLIRDEFIWDLLGLFTKLILHPNDWIKQFSLQLVVDIAQNMSFADVYCLLYPILRPYIEYDVTEFTWDTLYSITKRQLSRQVYNICLNWSAKADESSLFWRKVKSGKVDSFGNNGWEFSSVPVDYIGSTRQTNKNYSIIFGNMEILLSSEDKIWIDKLIKAGLSEQELWKVADFRDYIYRFSNSQSRANSPTTEYFDVVHTQQLGVLPKNVFFDTKKNADAGNFNSIDITQLDDRFQSLDIPESFSTNPNSIIDDRLVDSSTSNNGFDMTRVPSLSPSTEDPTKSLIIGVSSTSKAAPTITTYDEHVYAQMNSSRAKSSNTSNKITVEAKKLQVNPQTQISPISHSYIGKDPYILKYLNSVKFEPSLDEYKEFQKVTQTRHSSAQSFGHADLKNWAPQGELVSHLNEHEAKITTIDVSPDNRFFITGDNDGFLKVWDISKLEMNVSQDSLLTIDLSSPVLKLKYLKNYNSFVVATKNGLLRIVALKFNNIKTTKGKASITIEKVVIIRELKFANEGEYALDLKFGESSKFRHKLYTTTTLSKIYVIDIRTMSITTILQNNPWLGFITSFTIDENHSWLIAGTSKGVLCHWDLRFEILLRSWKLPNNLPVIDVKSLSSNYQVNRKKGRFVVINDGAYLSILDVSQGLVRDVLLPVSKEANGPGYDYSRFQVTDLGSNDSLAKEVTLSSSKIEFTSMRLVETHTEQAKTAHVVASNVKQEIVIWDLYSPESSIKLMMSNINETSKFQSHQINSNFRLTKEYILDSEIKKMVKSKAQLNQLESEHNIRKHKDQILKIGMILSPYEMFLTCDRYGTVNVYK